MELTHVGQNRLSIQQKPSQLEIFYFTTDNLELQV